MRILKKIPSKASRKGSAKTKAPLVKVPLIKRLLADAQRISEAYVKEQFYGSDSYVLNGESLQVFIEAEVDDILKDRVAKAVGLEVMEGGSVFDRVVSGSSLAEKIDKTAKLHASSLVEASLTKLRRAKMTPKILRVITKSYEEAFFDAACAEASRLGREHGDKAVQELSAKVRKELDRE